MIMQTLLLICALGIPQMECGLETADTVVQGPEAMSLVECGMHGQAYIAGGALAGYLDDQHYLKVSCTPGRRSRARGPWPVQQEAQALPRVEANE